MHKIKQFFRSGLCLMLVAALLLPLLPVQGIAAAADEDDFTPILRFAVTSDVHIRDASSALNGYEMLAMFYDTAYDYSEAQTSYNKLDGIFVLGDLAQDGTVDQLTYFFDYSKAHIKDGTLLMTLLGNHEFYDTGRDWDGDAAPNRFMEIGGYDATDHHIEMSGYHFILLSMDRYDTTNNVYFSDKKLAWLKDEIEKAVADDPNKPIFVMQHESPYGTMKGSSGTASDKNLTPLLANYPQVVNFSGHTHVSLSDPRVIWQDTFTALNTGSLAYLSIPIMDGTNNEAGGRGNDMEGGWTEEDVSQGTRNGGMYYIVEVDAQHRTRILTYNIFSESLWGEPYLIESYDPADFVYTDAREENAAKPEFPANAAIRVCSDNYRNVKIAFTQATCKDVVQSYRVELYQGNTLLTTTYRSSMANYGEAAPSEITAYFPNLEPNTAYTVKVYAGSSYNLHSEPISMQFTTAPETGKVAADVLDVVFREDGSAVNKADGTVLETFGTPTVEYDANAGTYTASFDGVDDAYSFHGLGNWYDAIDDSFTIETYAYIPDKPSASMGIMGNQSSSAGFSIRYLKSGAVKLTCYVEKSDKEITTGSLKNRWAHLTATYDGNTLKLYVNGVSIGELVAEGTMSQPEAAYYTRSLFLGADCQLNGARYYFDGKIATARVYSQVLSDADVAELYNTTIGTAGEDSCQEHPKVTNWTSVSNANWAAGGSISSGHYRLTENVNISAALTVAENATVCIDLAGFNITASAEAADGKWYRVFENEGTLTIMNSTFSDGVISGGVAWTNDTSLYIKGGNIYNGANAVFNLYDGIIYGGTVTTADVDVPGSMGGNIYGAAGSVINIKGGAVTAGVATKGSGNTKYTYIYGGNIYSAGTVNISGGTISNGYSFYRGGNLAILDGGTTNLSGSAVVTNGTISDYSTACRGDNIVVTGKKSTLNVYDNVQITEPNSDYDIYVITNGIVAVHGGRIAGGVQLQGTASNKDAKFSMYGGYVKALKVSSYITNLQLCNGVLGQAPTTGWLAECACYVNNGDGTYSIWHDGASDGTCTACGYNYTGITLQTGKHDFAMTGDSTAACRCGSTKAGVFTIIDGFACTTLDEAQSFLSSGDTIVLEGNILKGSTVTKDLILDLNGFDVAANITVASGISCYIKDSQTDDLTVYDDYGYGKITGTISGVQAADGYVQIAETDGTSFHKVNIRLKSASLRASSVGIYYTAEYLYDEVVARNLAASGVTLSTETSNPVADDSDASSLYTTTGNSVLLSNIMKTDNSASANNANARQAVYGRAYLQFNDGSYLYSDTVTTNLRDVVETIDGKLWDNLTEDQKASLAQMYSTYSDVMDSWQIDNLKNYQA